MKNPSEDNWDDLRLKVLGLGESSLHRTHPGLRQRLTELERFRALTDLAGDLLLAIELPSGRILELNQTACREVGRSRDELLCETFQSVFGKAALEALLKDHVPPRQERLVVTTEVAIGPELVPAEIVASFTPMRNHTHAVLAIRDIRERLRAEAELHETVANLAQASRLAHLGTWNWDLQRDHMQWSGELCRILGAAEDNKARSPEDLFELVVASDRERVREAFATAIQQQSAVNIEFRFVRQNETSERFAHSLAEMVPKHNDKPAYFLGALQDITDRKRLEQQFLQAQKLESVGRLAGGVAHDFNNLLTVINGYNELAASALHPGDPLQTYLSEVRKAGERACGLTQQLLAFSRRQIVEPKPINVNVLVTDMGKMLRRLIGENIELITVLDPTLDLILADPGQITQVLMNLVVNARDAMPDGGRLVIETANTEFDQDSRPAHADVQPGRYVQVVVSDNGVGMSKEVQAHIFEPFFTTKAHGAGTGLGLATVYGIVKQSGGWLWVYSEPGVGTTFKIYLPVTERKKAQADDAEVPRSLLRGNETILVIEDQPEVRKLIAEGLRTYGYQVLEAGRGEEALFIYGQPDRQIHLVVTDMVMPGLTGHQVAERLASLNRDVKVLYMSGYTENVISRQGMLDAGINYIAKPFTPAGLAARVRQLLGPTK
jgi:PAS domain S-box-containing protein